MATETKTTTWGDCPNPECCHYGRMRYGIEPGEACGESGKYEGCWTMLRWWDRWHDGKHYGDRGIAACEASDRG